jgi:hypothetical protein
MDAIRLHTTVEVDGEIRLRGLPLKRGQSAEVVIISDGEEQQGDDALLALLTHDPAWQWIHDPAEDLYTEQDVQ